MPSKIEWTGETWNPTRGCTRVSEGCRNCYAERQALRQANPGGRYEGLVKMTPGGPRWTGEVRLVPEMLDRPTRWRKPRTVFVDSMSDLFHEDVPDEFIAQVFGVMASCQRHTFQILTKRPERARDWLSRCANWGGWITHDGTAPAKAYDGTGIVVGNSDAWPLPNVWLGTSVEDQPTADERIPLLLQTPAAVRFVSAEPLLGAVDLRHLQPADPPTEIDALGGTHGVLRPHGGECARLDWIIVGGESGPGARPMHPDWARSIRDQCQAAGTKFFFKQWGAWRPLGQGDSGCPTGEQRHIWPDGREYDGQSEVITPECAQVSRVGKKAAGRLLDGRTWDEMPAKAGEEVNHGA